MTALVHNSLIISPFHSFDGQKEDNTSDGIWNQHRGKMLIVPNTVIQLKSESEKLKSVS